MTFETGKDTTLIEKLIEQLVVNARQSGKLEERFDRLDERVSHLETDVAQLKTDVSQLKTDVGELKTDVSEIKVGLGWLRWIGGGIVTIALALVANFISRFF